MYQFCVLDCCFFVLIYSDPNITSVVIKCPTELSGQSAVSDWWSVLWNKRSSINPNVLLSPSPIPIFWFLSFFPNCVNPFVSVHSFINLSLVLSFLPPLWLVRHGSVSVCSTPRTVGSSHCPPIVQQIPSFSSLFLMSYKFHWPCVPCLCYAFICAWAFWVFPCLGAHTWDCCKNGFLEIPPP